MFSIVIPTYRRSDVLRQTLASIRGQSYADWEVLVVDQSEEPQAGEIRSAVEVDCSPQCRYMQTFPPSSTAARNVGMRAARGEWVVFCDDDVIWPPDLLERVKRRLEETPALVMIGGLDFEHPGRPGSVLKRFFRRLSCQGPWRQDRGIVLPSLLARYPDVVESPVPTEWAMGYWFAARREFLVRHHLLFDERLTGYAYAEDLDFTFRLFRAAAPEGAACMLYPEIGVRHLVSQEWRAPTANQVNAFVENRLYLLLKLYTGGARVGALVQFIISLFAITPRHLRQGSFRLFLNAIRHALLRGKRP